MFTALVSRLVLAEHDGYDDDRFPSRHLPRLKGAAEAHFGGSLGVLEER